MRNLRLFTAIALVSFAGPSLAQDAAKGENVFKKCKACHAVGPDAKSMVGPQLNGIIGRKPGGVEGFAYSNPMKAYGEKVPAWDDATLDAYLADPKGAIPGNKMAFVGLKKPEERADVIAYLKQFPAK